MRPEALLPLTPQAQLTLEHLSGLHPEGRLHVSPFCYETVRGQREVRGWALDVPAHAHASSLPVGPHLFDGVTLARCELAEDAILRLLLDKEGTRKKLGDAVRGILDRQRESPHLRACWSRCRPTAGCISTALCGLTKTKEGSVILTPSAENVPVCDGEPWTPELSPEGFVGLYHHWYHDVNGAELRLYMACRSSLPSASLEFANQIHVAADGQCSAAVVHASEEAHWLRRTSMRNRCRILSHVSQLMKIPIFRVQDHNACQAGGSDDRTMAMPCAETLYHDMRLLEREQVVRVFNYCANTADAANGVICSMAPWQGLLIFHGRQPLISNPSCFGIPYGHFLLPAAMPETLAAPTRGKASKVYLSYTNSGTACRDALLVGAAASASSSLPAPKADAGGDDEAPQAEGEERRVEFEDADMERAFLKAMRKERGASADDLGAQQRARHAELFGHTYLALDENLLQVLSQRGWEQGNGYTRLMPHAVATAKAFLGNDEAA